MNTYEELETWAMDQVQDSYELYYVDYHDELSQDQITALIDGDTDLAYELAWEYSREYVNDMAWDEAMNILDRLKDMVDPEVWEEHEAEIMDKLKVDLVIAIEQNDQGVSLVDLCHNTAPIQVMVPVIDEDEAEWAEQRTPDQLLGALGLPCDEAHRTEARFLINEAPTDMGMAYIQFEVRPEALIYPDFDRLIVKNPKVVYGNPFTGGVWDSHSLDIFKDLTMHVNRYTLLPDNAWGYSVEDIYGGNYYPSSMVVM